MEDLYAGTLLNQKHGNELQNDSHSQQRKELFRLCHTPKSNWIDKVTFGWQPK